MEKKRLQAGITLGVLAPLWFPFLMALVGGVGYALFGYQTGTFFVALALCIGAIALNIAMLFKAD
jgi:hypothetical protein